MKLRSTPPSSSLWKYGCEDDSFEALSLSLARFCEFWCFSFLSLLHQDKLRHLGQFINAKGLPHRFLRLMLNTVIFGYSGWLALDCCLHDIAQESFWESQNWFMVPPAIELNQIGTQFFIFLFDLRLKFVCICAFRLSRSRLFKRGTSVLIFSRTFTCTRLSFHCPVDFGSNSLQSIAVDFLGNRIKEQLRFLKFLGNRGDAVFSLKLARATVIPWSALILLGHLQLCVGKSKAELRCEVIIVDLVITSHLFLLDKLRSRIRALRLCFMGTKIAIFIFCWREVYAVFQKRVFRKRLCRKVLAKFIGGEVASLVYMFGLLGKLICRRGQCLPRVLLGKNFSFLIPEF